MTETPKSAVELVMERLRQRDTQAGTEGPSLTDAQKAAIAKARQIAEAKLAERKILHESALAVEGDPDKRTVLADEYRRDLDRITYDRDRRIEKVRRGGEASSS